MIAYTLKKQEGGQWSICCLGSPLANGLSLETAIGQARHMAYTSHMDSGSPTCVEVISTDAHKDETNEALPEPHWRSVMA